MYDRLLLTILKKYEKKLDSQVLFCNFFVTFFVTSLQLSLYDKSPDENKYVF